MSRAENGGFAFGVCLGIAIGVAGLISLCAGCTSPTVVDPNDGKTQCQDRCVSDGGR